MTVYLIEWADIDGKDTVLNRTIVVSDNEESAKTIFGGVFSSKQATIRKLERSEAAQFVHSRLDDLIPDKEKA
mgnify:CR=1 FL=1